MIGLETRPIKRPILAYQQMKVCAEYFDIALCQNKILNGPHDWKQFQWRYILPLFRMHNILSITGVLDLETRPIKRSILLY